MYTLHLSDLHRIWVSGRPFIVVTWERKSIHKQTRKSTWDSFPTAVIANVWVPGRDRVLALFLDRLYKEQALSFRESF